MANARAQSGDALAVASGKVTSFIGPSGCGKSTLLRVLNRMYDLYPGQRAEGEVLLDGENILAPDLDLNLLRARVGMVFQKPTPFPMSIYDNIAFGVRLYERLPQVANWTSGSKRSLRARGAVGRGQGQAQRQRPRPFRRPAAAPVHRPHRRHQPRGDPVRRAVLGARSDLDRQGRGADRRIAATTTPSPSSPTTCSRRRAFRSSPPSCISAKWSNSATTNKVFTSPRDKRTQDYITGRFG